VTQLDTSRKIKSFDLPINRGVELILGEKSKPKNPNPFLLKFGKMISIFKKEIHFEFEFSIYIKKRSLGE
jgi:hypothetical protein